MSARTQEHVTLLAGTDFLLCDLQGEVVPGGTQGYFVGDTRLLSQLAVRFDGEPAETLRHEVDAAGLTVVGTLGDPVAPRLLVERQVRLSDVVRLRISLENLTAEAAEVAVSVTVGSDFADIFEVKRGDTPRSGFVGSGPVDGAFRLSYAHDGFHRGVTVRSEPVGAILRDGLHIVLAVEPRGQAVLDVEVAPEEETIGRSHSPLTTSGPDGWQPARPTLTSSTPALATSWERACVDVASLLLRDPQDPGRTIVAAGSPWFMALFGRDSLITSWQALPLGPGLAVGTLSALAARQGTGTVEATDEQPGRIPHEVRSGEAVRRPDGWGEVYYGSVDATPLFVMTLAEAWRWGADPDAIRALLPAAERAVAWMAGPGDPDADGFVEYPGSQLTLSGLPNQGWKDSDDSIRQPDGTLADGPIALVEVQGYCHAALLALADLRAAFATGEAEPLVERAHRLREAIDEQFWMDDEDCYALALDGAKRPVRTVTSNAGHLLWTGTAADRRAGPLSARLMAGDLYSGHGLRTLTSANPGYNPLSYHCGSVWPHDTAIVAAGMLRAGQTEAGWQLASSLLTVAGLEGGRLPELFGGFAEAHFARPVPYPTSCSPQAWAAAAPLLLTRALLGLDPDLPQGVVRISPALPEGVELEVGGIPLGDGHLHVRCVGRAVEVVEAPPGLDLDLPAPP
jgi:glycogen debranching enzyme